MSFYAASACTWLKKGPLKRQVKLRRHNFECFATAGVNQLVAIEHRAFADGGGRLWANSCWDFIARIRGLEKWARPKGLEQVSKKSFALCKLCTYMRLGHAFGCPGWLRMRWPPLFESACAMFWQPERPQSCCQKPRTTNRGNTYNQNFGNIQAGRFGRHGSCISQGTWIRLALRLPFAKKSHCSLLGQTISDTCLSNPALAVRLFKALLGWAMQVGKLWQAPRNSENQPVTMRDDETPSETIRSS